MEEFINILIEQVVIWAPSVVSILGIVFTTLKSMGVFKQLREDKTFQELKAELKSCKNELKETKEQLDILIDDKKKVKEYRKNR